MKASLNNKILLIGFMGSGKSTVGSLLAKDLELDFVDMDKYIAKQENKLISDIFKESGQIGFRELEIESAKKLSQDFIGVIASGGGVVENKLILDYYKAAGFVCIYLEADFGTLKTRLRDDSSRPLFGDLQAAAKLYTDRLALYKRYADKSISVDNYSVQEVVDKIIEFTKLEQ